MRLVFALLCLGLAAAAPAVQAQQLTPQGRERITAFMQAATGERGHLGAVTLVAGADKLLDLQAFGWRDLQRRVTMTPDSIFRIYSMSKSVAAVATLMLAAQGRLTLDDPLAKHLPEFAQMMVFAGGSAAAPVLRPARRLITIRQLLTHTAGFATGGAGIEEASRLLESAEPQRAADLKDFAARVARVPLANEPGARYRYDGVPYEVLGRVIEVASGMPLHAFVQQHIFGPLQMRDTGFGVPMAQRARVVDLTTLDTTGRLVRAAGPSAIEPGARLRAYDSLAGGLYSTAADYMRFCQMLLNAGTLDGVTILTPAAVEVMLSNQLQQSDPPAGLAPTQSRAGEGLGLGGWVILDHPQRRRPGAVGSFGWLGAASTYFMIDRERKLVAILLLQHLPIDSGADLPKLNTAYFDHVYQALAPTVR